jgi:hypothetical protein
MSEQVASRYVVSERYTLSQQWVTQYIEADVMHFLFNILIIKGLHMLRALLIHSQEALYKRRLVYCVQ